MAAICVALRRCSPGRPDCARPIEGPMRSRPLRRSTARWPRARRLTPSDMAVGSPLPCPGAARSALDVSARRRGLSNDAATLRRRAAAAAAAVARGGRAAVAAALVARAHADLDARLLRRVARARVLARAAREPAPRARRPVVVPSIARQRVARVARRVPGAAAPGRRRRRFLVTSMLSAPTWLEMPSTTRAPF